MLKDKTKPELKFVSKIATSMEQSQTLLNIGLAPETADMCYHYTNSKTPALQWELKTYPPVLRGSRWTPERIAKLVSPLYKHPNGTPMTGEEIFDRIWGKDIPAWSLSRLIELIPKQVQDPEDRYDPSEYHSEFITLNDGYMLSFRRHHNAELWIGSHKEKDPFECYVSIIKQLIEQNRFNKDYLIK